MVINIYFKFGGKKKKQHEGKGVKLSIYIIMYTAIATNANTKSYAGNNLLYS